MSSGKRNILGGSGTDRANAFVSSHHEPTHIDPNEVSLPQPFVVCVVGASRGIGAGCALAYAKAGASGIALASRDTSGLEETAKSCRAINSNVQAEILSCDITSAVSVAALAQKTKDFFGRLDVLVVNSGYSGAIVPKITDIDPEEFAYVTNVNYLGTAYCAKYFVPLLLESNGAKTIIGINSWAALIVRGQFANPQYCVSKTAQARVLEMIHEAHSEEGLKSFALHPGGVRTKMANDTAPKEILDLLQDSPDLAGAFAVWLTKENRAWLSGRLLSACWDVDELLARKDEIVEHDLLKFKYAA